jgi:ArsR family transcriptional regulator
MLSEELQLFLKALASEKRQEMMFLFLDHRELSVSQVAELVNISQSTASEQLAILKRAGLISSRKVGKEVLYTPNKTKAISLLQDFAEQLTNCCK